MYTIAIVIQGKFLMIDYDMYTTQHKHQWLKVVGQFIIQDDDIDQ